MRYDRIAAACRRVQFIVGPMLASLALSVAGNPVNISYLEGQSPVAPDAITAYGPDLFGDRINLFNGALSFEQTDLSLPGNSALPVALVRSTNPGRSAFIRGQFGDWDLEVPRLGGTFSALQGWVTSSGGTNRCSGYSLPPVLSVSALAAPPAGVQPPATGASGPGADLTIVGFNATDYWQGTNIHVAGLGAQAVLLRAPGYPAAPTDGGIYPLVTHANWQISCLPAVQNAPGEGFVAISPDGVRYRFDWMATRAQTSVKKAGATLARQDMFLMATQVSDRFGNWVRYTFDPARPLLLTRMESSDGRVITVSNSAGRAITASDGTRTYTYSYAQPGNLIGAQRPDGSRWTFDLAPMVPVALQTAGEGATCDNPGDFPVDAYTGTITHPSGATGTFTTQFTLLGTSFVDRVCIPHPLGGPATIGAVYPRFVSTQALTGKRIAGPGMAPMAWSYAYAAPGGWNPCTGCVDQRTVTVTEPDGAQTRHVFGSRWRVSEGQLQRLDEGWTGAGALRTTTHRYRLPAGEVWPERFGMALSDKHDWLSSRHRPLDQRVVTQQNTTFTWEVGTASEGFDGMVRPLQVRKISSVGWGRIDVTRYADNRGLWVMGQVEAISLKGGPEIERHEYHPTTALRMASWSFGRRVQTFDHYPDGTLSAVGDAAGKLTRLYDHRRGKPQRVVYADGTNESQVVNNLGNPDSRTNAAGTTTTFGYDPMGRVSSIAYPSGDAVAYFPTSQVFEQATLPRYGLEAGHWRQTINTGNAYVFRYFDALWRERVEVRYDVADPASTLSAEETRYDLRGRKSFESYPEPTFTTVDAARNGRRTAYDALGRVTTQQADSELGVLTTLTSYSPTAFRRTVTNPRGQSTTYAFQAFDTPSEDSITQIEAPEGVAVYFERDVFGKPRSILRGGGAVALTRNYVYDGNQRLCKTYEPETGATVQAYDAAGNVAWKASGLVLGDTFTCEQATVPEARKATFGYDLRDRLTTTTYGDGSPGISRTYTADGLPATIVTPSSAWALAYNNRRLLTAESLATGAGTFAAGYGIDPYGNVASMVYPGGGPTVAYNPDAFGRPRAVGGFVFGIRYHPNGQLAGYVAGNGVTYSVTQNLRLLPEMVSHGGVTRDLYAYDANGNVSSITDLQEGVATRAMAYDGLDRLITANGPWGAGSYTYDALDNLRTSRVGGRVLTHAYDRTNRLRSVTGTISATIDYDANGNVINRAGQGFVFDIGNRMVAATGLATHLYDGHGRRIWTQFASGRSILRAYSQAGRLLYTQDSAKGNTWHIHLGDKVVAERNTVTGTQWLHTDLLGSPVARTGTSGAVLERTRYEPFGAVASGAVPDGVGFTGHVNDPDTGLVYMQQRYQDPIAGRFLSVDPIVADTKDAANFTRYAYAANTPYKLKDPDGRAPEHIIPDEMGGGVSRRSSQYGAVVERGADGRAVQQDSRANLQSARDANSNRTEGRYEFPDKSADKKPYVGQSCNCERRLSEHERAGRYDPGTATVTPVEGGRVAREIAEHRRIQEITGGVPARQSDAVSNKVDPIGPSRQHLLKENK